MNKKDISNIEKRLSETLQQTVSQPADRVQANLLAQVRKQKKARKSVFAQAIPLWQVAALLLLGLGFHYLFPTTIIQEKTIVQTEIQPEYIYQTDTIVEYKNIEKIVYRNIPVEVIKYVEIPIQQIQPSLQIVISEHQIIPTEELVADEIPKNTPQPTMSRTVRDDADIMEFAAENQPYNSFINPLSDK